MSDADLHSTGMRCFSHSQKSCFGITLMILFQIVHYLYVDDIKFQYREREGTYTNFLQNPKGNVSMGTSRNHNFLLIYRNTVLHTSAESSHNYIENPSSSITSQMILLLSIPMTHSIQHIMIEKRCPGNVCKSN